MNEKNTPRGNKARNDKSSILCDTKNLLKVMLPAIQRMPKIERIEGAPAEMKKAAIDMIRYFNIAKECIDVRQEYIRRLFGCYGILLATFDICITQGLFTDSVKLAIAVQLTRIEEGIRKWRGFTRASNRQVQCQVGEIPFLQEGPASTPM